MTSALFGRNATSLGSTNGNKHLIEVRAGKMYMKGKMVHPDTRKGLLYMYRSDDSLIHLCWQDRTTAVIEDDLIIFPDDCEFMKVTQCPESARVYSLKFKTSRRLFFWMQEPNKDKDDEICTKVNQFMNNPASSIPTTSNNSSRLSLNATEQDLQSLLNNMSQAQLMQLFSRHHGSLNNLLSAMNNSGAIQVPAMLDNSSSTPTTPSVTPASVQSSGMSTPKTSSGGTSTSAASACEAPATDTVVAGNEITLSEINRIIGNITSPNTAEPKIDLSTSLNVGAMAEFLNKKEVKDRLKPFVPALGDAIDQDSQVALTLQSPQFQNALSQFTHALQSGRLGPVMESMHMNRQAIAAARKGSLNDFITALEECDDMDTTSNKDDKEKPE